MTLRGRALLIGAASFALTVVAGHAIAAFLGNTVIITGISITTSGGPLIFAARLLPTADTKLVESGPDDNFGAADNLYVSSKVGRNERSLFRFDLSVLPASASLQACSLNLWLDGAPGRGSRDHAAYRLSDHEIDWGEGTHIGTGADPGESSWDWFAQPNAWTTPGGDLAATPTDTIATGEESNVWRAWNVLPDCDQLQERSWLVRDTVEDASDTHRARYKSKEETLTEEDPYLAVSFSADPATTAHVVINEAFYDVSSGQGSEGDNEWVELYNPTATPIDLAGWRLCDSQSCVMVPAGTIIPATEFLVATPNASTFDYWTVPANRQLVLGVDEIGNGLSNGSDAVLLKDASSVLVDAMSYGGNTSAFSPSVPGVDPGWSLPRLMPGHDTDQATDFWPNPDPTPGTL
ncbi:lamin tail domain-containing protein [Candidatus Berkelbacteria bacterium]|nr:lamin tail domain-containing protein [Candidatus Berkelbacteria bacterium]